MTRTLGPGDGDGAAGGAAGTDRPGRLGEEATSVANPEHLALLRERVEAWNPWMEDRRLQLLNTSPDLTRADLTGANLTRYDQSPRWATEGDSLGGSDVQAGRPSVPRP